MANFLTSSIGKKFIQSVSGAFLVIFLLLHGTINFFSVIDSLKGQFGKVAGDAVRFSTGDGWFQLGCDFMSTPVIDIMVPILALGFLIHIVYGCWLSYENIKKRGGLKRYEVPSKAQNDSWSAKNMAVLGVIVLGFLAFHLTAFQGKSAPEAAKFLNIDVNTVYVAKSRCVTRLQEIIRAINTEDPDLNLKWNS